MAINSPTTLAGRDRMLNLASFKVDGEPVFTDLSTPEQNFYLDQFELALGTLFGQAGWEYGRRDDGELTIKGPESAGDADFVEGSAAVTSDNGSTDWSTGTPVNAGLSHIHKNGDDGAYLVKVVVGAQSLTIGPPYGSDTAADAAYSIVNDDYELTDPAGDGAIWELLSFREVSERSERLQIVSHDQYLRMTGGRFIDGRPEMVVILGRDPQAAASTGTNFTIRLWPAPDSVRAYSFSYRTVPSFPTAGGQVWENSPQAMNLLLWKALEYIYTERDLETKAAIYQARYDKELLAFQRDIGGSVEIDPRLLANWPMGDQLFPRGLNLPDRIPGTPT